MFHLAKRAVTSFRNHPVTAEEQSLAQSILLPDEFRLWSSMQNRDQRHSVEVLHRFEALCPHATRDERAAALLHDVGKCESALGWSGRILATIIGPRTEAFRVYLNHEEIGLQLLDGLSSYRTLEILSGHVVDDVLAALQAADNS